MHRNDNDHLVMIKRSNKKLGFYSNRNGNFRNSGHILNLNARDLNNEDEFTTIIVVGEGNSNSSYDGTSKFYIGNKLNNPILVGESDRVACGTRTNLIGYDYVQGPGLLSVAGILNQKLNESEILNLHNMLINYLK